MLNCIIHGRVVNSGVIDRSKSNKPNLNFVDIYVEGDGGTHRVYKFPNPQSVKFGDSVTLSVNSYDGEREYLAYISEVS